MPLNAGDRFAGHFDVAGPLGAGGMGEVYRARDTRLNRDVALKILPDAFADDPDRLARFQREAELLASLNHPNIAQIHGLEEDGGTRALVLELVEGPTLEERIARGPIPLDEALDIAARIADALEAAHAAGVIHRDLKPANVKVRHDGAVKVLDFGLAKALEAGPASGPSHDSATLATAATQLGVIVGTAAYMSPEQARGRPVDRRADVWAFGAVVYEMLTGRKAFEGDDVTGILAEVIKSEPAWASLSADVPRAVSGVLRRCLAKDPGERLRDIADVRLGLLGAFDDPDRPAANAVPAPAPGSGRRRRAAELAVAAVLAATVAGLGVRSLPAPEPPVPDPVRFTIPASPNVGPILELSPDGRYLAYLESDESREPRLWVHSFASGDARPLAETEVVGTPPFWSPDGRSIAFSDGSTLKRVDVVEGVVESIGDVPGFLGGSWNESGVIVFGSPTGIIQVPAAGGTPAPVTALDAARGEGGHAAPRFLPDGRHFLYLRVSTDPSVNGLYVGALGVDPGEQDPTRLLATGLTAAYVAATASTGAGRLLFMEDRRLFAQPFDHTRRQLAGSPTVVAEDVDSFNFWAAFSAARTGTVAWFGANTAGSVRWLDPTGDEWPPGAIGGLNAPRNPRLSPDGRRLALVEDGDLWVFDLDGRPPIRLTFDDYGNATPVWTPDGSRIVYEAEGGLAWVSADGGSPPEPIGPRGHYHAHAWSSTGDLIAIDMQAGRLVELSPEPDAAPRPLEQHRAGEGFHAALSPDGRWLAYVSSVTGQREIWVRAYPGPGAPARVSPNGGSEPEWAGDGRTLYYVEGRALMAVPVDTSTGFEFGAPVRLFEGDFRQFLQPPSYDVSADGRFVTIHSDATPPVSVLLNWPGLLRPAGDD